MPIFEKETDFTAFEQVLQEAVDRTEMRPSRTPFMAYITEKIRCELALT